jgi:hypothetical protein
MAQLEDPDVRSTLELARQLYVAVIAPAGPHVTPELYAVADGRLWFWTAHTTVKAKVLADDDRVAGVVLSPERAVVLHGRAERFDPKDLRAVPRALRQPRAIGEATLRFGLRNAADLGAFATDYARGRLGRSIPPRRVLVGIRPEAVEVVDVPRGRLAVLAWATDAGVRAAPCALDEDDTHVDATVDLAPNTPVAVVVDDYVAPGPAAKEGTLLRGTGSPTDDGRIVLDAERITDWRGVATATTKR